MRSIENVTYIQPNDPKIVLLVGQAGTEGFNHKDTERVDKHEDELAECQKAYGFGGIQHFAFSESRSHNERGTVMRADQGFWLFQSPCARFSSNLPVRVMKKRKKQKSQNSSGPEDYFPFFNTNVVASWKNGKNDGRND